MQNYPYSGYFLSVMTDDLRTLCKLTQHAINHFQNAGLFSFLLLSYCYWLPSKTYFCSRIFCWHKSGQWMDIERLTTDEVHFHFQSFVNTPSCKCEWATENTFMRAPVPLHSAKVWWQLPALFVIETLFFEKMDPPRHVISTVSNKHYERFLPN